MYSFNGLSVKFAFVIRPLSSSVLPKTSYGKNKEYNSVVISSFDREKWDAGGVVFIIFIDFPKKNNSLK